MKVRFIKMPHITGDASRFNTAALAEVIVGFDGEGGMDTCYIKDLEVEIDDEWITMRDAFREHKLITDNYDTHFFTPKTEKDKERGYML